MQALIEVILPVFFVIGFGYLATWRGWFSDSWNEGLTQFTQTFAIPCLLFQAIAGLELTEAFEPALLLSFYIGAMAGFLAGLFGARFLFRRSWEDAVAIGFVGLFSNTVLLGLPITERAYGTDAMEANFAIIAFHAPFCYALGITVMEVVRARAQGALAGLPRQVARAMFHNALIIGIGLGFAVNLTGIALPQVLGDGVALMATAALPAALFGLGGVLYRYRHEGDLRAVFFVCAVSLILHPVITWTLGTSFALDDQQMKSAVITASMAPGVNTYIFANMYGTARRVAASSVLIGTALSILTIWVWLLIL